MRILVTCPWSSSGLGMPPKRAISSRHTNAPAARFCIVRWIFPVPPLEESAQKLLAEYAHLSICAIHADFAGNPGVIRALRLEKKALAFFGSNLGNFTREESLDFLQGIAALLGPEDVFLLGVDLKKSPYAALAGVR